MSKTEKVGPGKLVTYSYKLTDVDNGNVLFEAKKDAPDVLIYGVSQDVLPGLIAAMQDLGPGDKFEVELPPSVAFGDYYPDNVLELDKSMFLNPEGEMPEEIKVGAMVPMLTQDGQRVVGVVKEIGDDKVKMDFNHPFAGKTVRFEGEIEGVRDATEEEKKAMQGHGCCGCGCSGDCDSGDCGGGDCGGGCH